MATTFRERSCCASCACCSPRTLIYCWWAVNTVSPALQQWRFLFASIVYHSSFSYPFCVLQALSASFAALAIVNSRHISVTYVGLLRFRNLALYCYQCSRSGGICMLQHRYTTLISKTPTSAKLGSSSLASWGQLWCWPFLLSAC